MTGMLGGLSVLGSSPLSVSLLTFFRHLVRLTSLRFFHLIIVTGTEGEPNRR